MGHDKPTARLPYPLDGDCFVGMDVPIGSWGPEDVAFWTGTPRYQPWKDVAAFFRSEGMTMGNDQETRMGVTFAAWTTPEEGEWPKRDAVPFVPADVFNAMFDSLISDGVVGVKDGRLITADEMYIGQRPAEVTPEMGKAGLAALGDCPRVTDFADVACVYRAMHALAPVELVSPAEITLIRERDEAIERMKSWACSAGEWAASNAALRAELATLQEEAKLIAEELLRYADEDRTLRAELAAGDNELSRELSAANGRIAAMSAELMAAHDKLARFTVRNIAAPESPDPIANAIRDHDTDRRRMGP